MQVTLKQGCTCVLLQTVEQNWCVKRNMFTASNTALGNELNRNRVVCTCVYTLIQLLSLHVTQSICGDNRHVISTWDAYNQLSNARKHITNTVKLKPMCENCRTQNNWELPKNCWPRQCIKFAGKSYFLYKHIHCSKSMCYTTWRCFKHQLLHNVCIWRHSSMCTFLLVWL